MILSYLYSYFNKQWVIIHIAHKCSSPCILCTSNSPSLTLRGTRIYCCTPPTSSWYQVDFIHVHSVLAPSTMGSGHKDATPHWYMIGLIVSVVAVGHSHGFSLAMCCRLWYVHKVYQHLLLCYGGESQPVMPWAQLLTAESGSGSRAGEK